MSDTPRTRQRIYKAPTPIDVPDIDEDAAERKRVLNVLAQRRYREKKRQRRLEKTKKPQPEEVVEEILPEQFADVDTSAMAFDFSLDPRLLMADVGPIPVVFGTTPPPSSSSSMSLTHSPPYSTPSDGMADSYLLPVHGLTLLRAMMRIATRIGCQGSVWSLEAKSPFNEGTATPVDQLPAPWRPTTAQVLTPHHPLLDFLPWPSARDKMLSLLDLPDEARPPSASGPLALLNFAYDIEDDAEGVRIYGEDPCDPDAWEVGQVLFQRWWFLFDRDIVKRSNRWRRLRGAPPLTLVTEEV